MASESAAVTSTPTRLTLLDACRLGKLQLVQQLISDSSCDLTVCDDDGNTALHLAAMHGHLGIIETLASRNTLPSPGENKDGKTPLHLLSTVGYAALLKRMEHTHLISQYQQALNDIANTVALLSSRFECSVLVKSISDEIILDRACYTGNTELVRKLSEKYSDTIPRDSQGFTLLHMAALGGNETLAIELMQTYKYSVDCVDSFLGRTALYYACMSGNVDLVRILISEYGSDPMARDSEGDTPLHVVARYGKEEVVRELVDKSKCPVDSVGNRGRTVLHHACCSDNIDLVRILISEYGRDPIARDIEGATPLHVAAVCGREEVVRELVDMYKCQVDSVSNHGRTVLHCTCQSGNVDLVRILISEYGSDPMARDSDGDTPLHVAALDGREEVVRELVDRNKCPVDSEGALGQTVLHKACHSGNVDLVRILISEYGSDPMARDSDRDTPLHVAALGGREEVVRELVDRHKCPVHSVGALGRTVLHKACQSGNVDLVRILISEYGSDPMARDSNGDTPLHVAALCGREEVVRELVDRHKCPVDSVGALGQAVLHFACGSGNVDLVRILISEYGSDPMARDSDGDTPLHVAALGGRDEVVRELVDRHKCPVDSVGALGRTVLHKACNSGNVDLVRILISEYGSDPMARDSDGDTPLHVAALGGRDEVVRELVDRHKCPVDSVGALGRSVLHFACGSGNVDLVRKLISEFAVDPMCVDDDGNTPMHIAALCNKVKIIKTLINVFQCFPCVRNNRYKLPYHLAIEKRNNDCIDELALYGEAECVPVLPKVLVAGSKFSGKTTLVEALKTANSNTQARDFAAYSCEIQLIQLVSSIGEVVVFELPCEPAQAAVVEILTSTSSCSAIVVVDVSKGKQEACHEVGYWLSFFSCSYKSQAPLHVTVVGSHVDMLPATVDAQEMLRHVCSEVSQSFYHGNIKITGSLAVRLPLATLGTLNSHLEEMIGLASRDNPSIVSNGALYLLKLLQMQLKGKSMCQLSEASELVAAKHFYPEGDPTEHLLIYLRELDTHGFLKIVDDKGSSLLILNIVSVLSILSAQIKESASVGPPTTLQTKGIIAEENLITLFPGILVTTLVKYLTKLQLCLQVANPGHLHVIRSELPRSAVQQIGENLPLVFFPCCIATESSHGRKWMNPKQVFVQGFFIKVAGKYEYLPLRFFHLLILNIAFTFVFPSSSRISPLDIQQCTLWKSGIQWLAANGVEIFMELARDERGVVVAGRSVVAEERECVSMLSAVMEEIFEAKSEFMNLDIFLIHPGELKEDTIPDIDAMQLFDMTEVQNALTRNYDSIPSTDCSRVLQRSEFSLLQTYTFWSKSRI